MGCLYVLDFDDDDFDEDLDDLDDDDLIRQYTRHHVAVNEGTGASVSSADQPGFSIELRESYDSQYGRISPSEDERAFWISDEVIWHESKHAFAATADFDVHVEGIKLAHNRNNGDYRKFYDGMIPLSFNDDGSVKNQWINWPDEHEHAKFHMFYRHPDRDYSFEDPTEAYLLGWNEWKDDVTPLSLWVDGRPEPSTWMPDNDDPVVDALEAANRSWWKQALTITNDPDPDLDNAKQISIISPYSATNAHETIAMMSQALHDPSLEDWELGDLYRYHAYLVKTLLILEGADPTVKSKLKQVAKSEGWDELLELL